MKIVILRFNYRLYSRKERWFPGDDKDNANNKNLLHSKPNFYPFRFKISFDNHIIKKHQWTKPKRKSTFKKLRAIKTNLSPFITCLGLLTNKISSWLSLEYFAHLHQAHVHQFLFTCSSSLTAPLWSKMETKWSIADIITWWVLFT